MKTRTKTPKKIQSPQTKPNEDGKGRSNLSFDVVGKEDKTADTNQTSKDKSEVRVTDDINVPNSSAQTTLGDNQTDEEILKEVQSKKVAQEFIDSCESDEDNSSWRFEEFRIKKAIALTREACEKEKLCK